jgi:prephenate dehydrogenase
MNKEINAVRIIGSGLIGTSIALALKGKGISIQMLDENAKAQKLATDLVGGKNLENPDLIIISASIDQNLNLIVDALKQNPGSIVMDVSSVKSNLLDEVAKLSGSANNFVSTHPMAGREVSGAQSARSDLFLGRAWIGIASDNTSEDAKNFLNQLVDICGATLYWLTANQHDEAVAAISHLPQILSTGLAYTLDKNGVDSLNLAGQGLRDLLRLSGSNPKLWSELLIANRDALKGYLQSMSATISLFQQSLDHADLKKLEEIFSVGNKVYSSIPGKHGGKSRNYAYLPIVINDEPGQLAKIFNECAEINVNIEDLTIEHSPGQQTGLITLAINEKDVENLSKHLQNAGWNVHTLKVDK